MVLSCLHLFKFQLRRPDSTRMDWFGGTKRKLTSWGVLAARNGPFLLTRKTQRCFLRNWKLRRLRLTREVSTARENDLIVYRSNLLEQIRITTSSLNTCHIQSVHDRRRSSWPYIPVLDDKRAIDSAHNNNTAAAETTKTLNSWTLL